MKQFLNKIYKSCTTHLAHFAAGIWDACSWNKTFALIQKTPQVFKLFKDIVVFNGLIIFTSLTSNSLLFPALEHFIGKTTTYATLEWTYWLAWSLPISCVSGILNVYYWGELADALPRKKQNSTNLNFIQTLEKGLELTSSKIYRILLAPGLLLQQYLISRLPYVGGAIHFVTTSQLLAFYQFEYHWDNYRWPILRQIHFLDNHRTYFLGFGLGMSTMLYYTPAHLINPVFAITLPFYITMASHHNNLIKSFELKNTQTENISLQNNPISYLKRILPFSPISKIVIYAITSKPLRSTLQFFASCFGAKTKHGGRAGVENSVNSFKGKTVTSAPFELPEPFELPAPLKLSTTANPSVSAEHTVFTQHTAPSEHPNHHTEPTLLLLRNAQHNAKKPQVKTPVAPSSIALPTRI